MKYKPNVYYATVNDVDVPSRTCSCTLVSGPSDISLDKVNLMAAVNDGLLRVPAQGSTVYILHVDGAPPWVDMFSQVQQVLYIVGDTQFSMVDGTAIMQQKDMAITLSGGMISIQNVVDGTTYDFKTIMDTHFENLFEMTFTNGAGTTSPPNNLTALQEDQTNFDNLFYTT